MNEKKKVYLARAITMTILAMLVLLTAICSIEVTYAATKPAKVSALLASSTPDSITLKWGKSKGASGYVIYRYSNKKYIKIKTTKSRIYTDVRLKSGKQYKYYVKAYRVIKGKNIYGTKSRVISKMTAQKPQAVTLLSVTTNNGESIFLHWKNSSATTGYKIYRAIEGKGYNLAKTTKSTSWNEDLAEGSSCQYYVVAYKTYGGKTYNSTRSNVVSVASSIKTPTQLTGLTALTVTEQSATLRWNESTFATGYQIYRNSNLIGSATDTEYIDTGLKSGTNYQYSVRPFRKVGNAVKYGSGESISAITPQQKVEEMKLVDSEGREVNEMTVGKEYILYSPSAFRESLKNDSWTSQDRNDVMSICTITRDGTVTLDGRNYTKATIKPTMSGMVFFKNQEDVIKRYTIAGGIDITAGGITIQLNAAIPQEIKRKADLSYTTIYGDTQYVFNESTENLTLVAEEEGNVKAILTFDDRYSGQLNEQSLDIIEYNFGGTLIAQAGYYGNKVHREILTHERIENLANEMSIIANGIRAKVAKTDSQKQVINILALEQPLQEKAMKYAELVRTAYPNGEIDTHVHGLNDVNSRYKPYGDLGENITTTHTTSRGDTAATAAMEAFYNSPGHRAAMLEPATDNFPLAYIATGINARTYNTGQTDFIVVQVLAY